MILSIYFVMGITQRSQRWVFHPLLSKRWQRAIRTFEARLNSAEGAEPGREPDFFSVPAEPIGVCQKVELSRGMGKRLPIGHGANGQKPGFKSPAVYLKINKIE